MPASLLDKLRKADRLPSAPGVAVRIVELNQRDDVDLDELSDILAQDPALVAKLLRTANSSLFGLPREITNVRQGVRILGLRSVNLLALSFSVLSVSTGESVEEFDYRSYWTETAITALASRMLAERFDKSLLDDAFLSGLLTDFGRMVMAECASDEYRAVVKSEPRGGKELVTVERESLGTDHMELGAELLASWGIPARVCAAVRWHHEPEHAQPDSQKLTRIVHLASLFGEVFAGDATPAAVSALDTAAREHFGADREVTTELLTSIAESYGDTVAALQLDALDADRMADVRARATDLLVRESLALTEQVHSVTSQMQSLAAQRDDLEKRATCDALTGLANRAVFDESIAEGCAGSAPLGLLLVDLDHFKQINDTCGHPAGDAVLRAVGEVLRETCGDALPCRYGGEEFAVLVPGGGTTALRELAERIRGAIAACQVDTPAGPLSVTASVGGHQCPEGARRTPAALIESADRQLYDAKHGGRDQVRIQGE